jgi:actin-related protein 8
MQEGLAAVFGNGLSTACIVNMGAQVTSVVCIEVTTVFCLKLAL